MPPDTSLSKRSRNSPPDAIVPGRRAPVRQPPEPRAFEQARHRAPGLLGGDRVHEIPHVEGGWLRRRRRREVLRVEAQIEPPRAGRRLSFRQEERHPFERRLRCDADLLHPAPEALLLDADLMLPGGKEVHAVARGADDLAVDPQSAVGHVRAHDEPAFAGAEGRREAMDRAGGEVRRPRPGVGTSRSTDFEGIAPLVQLEDGAIGAHLRDEGRPVCIEHAQGRLGAAPRARDEGDASGRPANRASPAHPVRLPPERTARPAPPPFRAARPAAGVGRHARQGGEGVRIRVDRSRPRGPPARIRSKWGPPAAREARRDEPIEARRRPRRRLRSRGDRGSAATGRDSEREHGTSSAG